MRPINIHVADSGTARKADENAAKPLLSLASIQLEQINSREIYEFLTKDVLGSYVYVRFDIQIGKGCMSDVDVRNVKEYLINISIRCTICT